MGMGKLPASLEKGSSAGLKRDAPREQRMSVGAGGPWRGGHLHVRTQDENITRYRVINVSAACGEQYEGNKG